MLGRGVARIEVLFSLLPLGASLAACTGDITGGGQERPAVSVGAVRSALETVPLIITEVAQSRLYGGSTADKVAVFCTAAGGCASYKVCDTTASGGSCSALQPALGSGQRAVVSRGTSITTSDDVWLADSAGAELANTRVG